MPFDHRSSAQRPPIRDLFDAPEPPSFSRGPATKLCLSIGLVGLSMVAYASPTLAAGEEVTAALNRAISWIMGAVLPLAVLMFIIGAVLLIAAPGLGGLWRGRTLMITAVLGLILAYLAYPIFNLIVSFTH